MYKNRAENGRNNISGHNIKRLRESLPHKPSQREFSEMLQREGLDVGKNVIQEIEAGKRFVTDIDLQVLAKIFGVSYDELLKEE